MFRVAVPSMSQLLADIPLAAMIETELQMELVTIWYFCLSVAHDDISERLAYKDFIDDFETPLNDNLKEIDWCPIKREIAHRYWNNYDQYSWIFSIMFERVYYHCQWLHRACPSLEWYDPSLMIVKYMSPHDTVLLFFRTKEEYDVYQQQSS